MKKFLIAFVVALLLLAVPLIAAAEEACEPETPEESVTQEAPVEGEDAAPEEENWFEAAKTWVAENAAGIIVSLVSLYMACPKIGGVAAILKIVRDVKVLLASLKKYISDEDNPDSIGNKLSGQGDVLVRFMNDLMPKMDALEKGLAALENTRVSGEKLKGLLLAIEESVELMAKEFNDLISTSTSVSAKQKAIMEEEFMTAKAHLHLAVKEALEGDEQGEKTTA